MRIAIPIWEDKISPVLDTASRLLVVQVKDQGEASRFEIYLDEQQISRRCLRIQGLGIDILICGAISGPFYRMLMASGIDVIPGISGQAENILDACLKGDLADSKFFMPGCQASGLREHFRSLDIKDRKEKGAKEAQDMRPKKD